MFFYRYKRIESEQYFRFFFCMYIYTYIIYIYDFLHVYMILYIYKRIELEQYLEMEEVRVQGESKGVRGLDCKGGICRPIAKWKQNLKVE